MNLFLFHPWIDRVKSGGMLIGELGMVLCFTAQYTFLLLALKRTRR
jgi:hypothetical protein